VDEPPVIDDAPLADPAEVRRAMEFYSSRGWTDGLPVVPVTTLEALAFQVMRRGGVHALTCLDARMGEVYWGCFAADAARGLIAAGAPRVGPPDSVALPLLSPSRRQWLADALRLAYGPGHAWLARL